MELEDAVTDEMLQEIEFARSEVVKFLSRTTKRKLPLTIFINDREEQKHNIIFWDSFNLEEADEKAMENIRFQLTEFIVTYGCKLYTWINIKSLNEHAQLVLRCEQFDHKPVTITYDFKRGPGLTDLGKPKIEYGIEKPYKIKLKKERKRTAYDIA